MREFSSRLTSCNYWLNDHQFVAWSFTWPLKSSKLSEKKQHILHMDKQVEAKFLGRPNLEKNGKYHTYKLDACLIQAVIQTNWTILFQLTRIIE